jgi:hypothetical protein
VRILLVVPYVPRPEMSGTLRSFFFLAGLARRHAVRLVVGTLDESFWTAEDVERVRPLVQGLTVHRLALPRAGLVRRAASWIATGLSPATPPWWLDRDFVQVLRGEVSAFSPDAILAEGPAALHCHDLGKAPVVVDFCDAHALRVDPARHGVLGAWWRRATIAREEAFVGSFARWTLAITERDAAAVAVPRDRVAVVPNGVDLDHYVPRPGAWEPRTLAFVGAMDYRPNADAALHMARSVWPLVRGAEPEARLLVVGRQPGPEVAALDGRDGITVTGTVEDVRPFVWRSAASVAPLRYASGLQNKILQSLAMAVPVVATPAANAGLGAGEEQGVLVAETPEALAAASVSLMRNPARRAALGERGRRFVTERFRWERAIELLEAVLERAIAGR